MNLPADIKARLADLTPEQRETVLKRLRDRRQSASVEGATQPYRLSPFQRRVWTAVHASESAAQTYNIHTALWFDKGFDVDALESSLRKILAANEVLRSRFYEQDGHLWQQPQPLAGWSVERRFAPDNDIESLVTEVVGEAVSKRFDLGADLLFNATTVQGGGSACALVLNLHHIVCDGLSLQFLVSDLERFYNAEIISRQQMAGQDSETSIAAEAPEEIGRKRLQFRHFVSEEPGRAEDVSYWLDVFRDPPERIDSLAQRPRLAQPDYAGASRSCHFDVDSVLKLRALCNEHRASMFMALLTLTQTLLGRVSLCSESTIGIPVAGRDRKNAQHVIGPFVNTVAIRQSFDGASSFIEALKETRTTVLGAMRHQQLPFEQVIGSLPYAVDHSRGPLFDVMLGVADEDEQRVMLNGSAARFLEIPCQSSKVDLTFHFSTAGEKTLKLELEYSRALFDEDFIERLLAMSQALLGSLVNAPSRAVSHAELASSHDVELFLKGVNSTQRPLPEHGSVATQFRTIANQYPAYPALVMPDGMLSYADLNVQSDQMARWLTDVLAVQPGEAVGILLDKDQRPILAMLAILKANACYVPLAPDTPHERVQLVCQATGGRFLLSDGKHGDSWRDSDYTVIDVGGLLAFDADDADSAILFSPEVNSACSKPALLEQHAGISAYVMFTSGTTGIPKGVVVSQRSILRLVCNTDFHQIEVGERVLLTGSLAFDAATFEIWGPLLNGGAVCIPGDNALLDMPQFHQLIDSMKVDTAFMTTGLFNQLVSENLGAFSELKTVLTGGEKISVSHANRLTKAYPRLNVLHVYGPTENTTFSTWHRITALDLQTVTVPIGRPIANSTVLLLDEAFNAVPVGVPGELYCGGDGVALGYLDPGANDGKFVELAGRAGIFYRTGDLGRWRADGAIEFIGRSDRQVKIRGFRIELAEIEFQLRAIDGIDNAFVSVIDREAKRELVAYWVASSTVDLVDTDIRNRLRENVPAYMVPTHLIKMQTLPLNASGKVDSRALPTISESLQEGADASINIGDMRSEKEILLAEWLGSVLNLSEQQRSNLARTDNFFSLGGDSILAIQLVSLARKAGYELVLQHIFQSENLAELAAEIQQAAAPIKSETDEALFEGPQTPLQQWWLERLGGAASHFNLSVVLVAPNHVDSNAIEKSLQALVAHHSALRIALDMGAESQSVQEQGHFAFIDQTYKEEPDLNERQAFWNRVQDAVDLESVCLLSAGLLRTPAAVSLGLVIHHLAADEVSSQIYLEHFRCLYDYFSRYDAERDNLDPPLLTAEDGGAIKQALALQRHVANGYFIKQTDYWSNVDAAVLASTSGCDVFAEANQRSLRRQVQSVMPSEVLDELHVLSSRLGEKNISGLLLAGLAHAWEHDLNGGDFAVMLEHNGRGDFGDFTGSVTTPGWFTSLYPLVHHKSQSGVWEALRTIRDSLRNVPDNGLGYLALRYSDRSSTLSANPLISFNYLGDLGQDSALTFTQTNESCGNDHGDQIVEPFVIDVLAWTNAGQLYLSVITSDDALSADTILAVWQSTLENLLSEYQRRRDIDELQMLGVCDCSFPFAHVEALDEFLEQHELSPGRVETIMPVTPMQEGMLLHALSGGLAYFDQVALRLVAELDGDHFSDAVAQLVQETALLRTGFAQTSQGQFAQVVHRQRIGVYSLQKQIDGCVGGVPLEEHRMALRAPPHDLLNDPLVRFELISLAENEYELIINFHHAVMDGWTSGLVLSRLESIYRELAGTHASGVSRLGDMSGYFRWLQRLDDGPSLDYWKQLLGDYSQRLSLPSQSAKLHDAAAQSASYSMRIDGPLYRDVHAFCVQQGVSISSYFQGLWGITLASYTGSKDVVFGATVSGRDVPVHDVEHVAGMLINTLPVRVSFDESTSIVELIKALGHQFAASLAHSRVGLADIQLRSGAKGGLLSHAVVFENYPDVVNEDGWQWKTVSVYDPMHYDFGVIVAPMVDALGVRFVYDPAIYVPAELEQLEARILQAAQASLIDNQTVQQLIAQNDHAPLTWSLSANFSVDPVVESLQFFENLQGSSRSVTLCPYDQIVQQLIDPNSERERSGAKRHVVFWRPILNADGEPNLIGSMAQLQDILEACRRLASEPNLEILILLMPWWSQDPETYRQLQAFLTSKCDTQSNLHSFSLEALGQRYAVLDGMLAPAQIFGDIPYSEHYYVALAAELSRWADFRARKPVKVIAVDADNTLWQGVVGEDGVEGVLITQQHLQLQERLLQARDSGVLLCVVSKNNPEDLEEIFAQRDMPLRREHLTRMSASWQPKSESILTLSRDLSLGLDSFVFLDDSPMECAEVESSCPGVRVIHLPEDWSQSEFVDHLWLLDAGVSTAEDRRRAEMYEQELVRVEERKKSSDFAAFLTALNLDIRMEIALESDFDRLSQLAIRTNQFNTTGENFDSAQLRAWSDAVDKEVFAVRVSDRYGDYGLVGCAVVNWSTNSFVVPVLMLSCRVLGRGVEHAILRELAQKASDKGFNTMYLACNDLPRNQPVRAFLSEFGEVLQSVEGLGAQSAYCFIPADAASWQVAKEHGDKQAVTSPQRASSEAGHEPFSTQSQNRNAFYRYVGSELNTAAAIILRQRRLWGYGAAGPHAVAASGMPSTNIQQTVAHWFTELLGVEQLYCDSHFFDLGGQSVKLMMLLARAQKRYGIALDYGQVLALPTIKSIADQIEVGAGYHTGVLNMPILIPEASDYPASPGQRRLWVLQDLLTNSAAFHMSAALRFEQKLEPHRLKQAIQLLLERHEALRTSLFCNDNGDVRQSIHVQIKADQCLSQHSETVAIEVARERIEAFCDRPFDLNVAPLFRCLLLNLTDGSTILAFTFHHAIADGISTALITSQLNQCYNEAASAQGVDLECDTPPAIDRRFQYRDYVHWMEVWQGGAPAAEARVFWQELYASSVEPLELPKTQPRPARRSGRGGAMRHSVSKRAWQNLQHYAASAATTPFIASYSALQLALARLSGQVDFSVGTVVSGRAMPEFEQVVGFFANVIPLRSQVDWSLDAGSYLARTQQHVTDCLKHSLLPFDDIVASLDFERDPSRSPIFDVLFVYQDHVDDLELDQQGAQNFELPVKHSQYELTLNVFPDAEQLHIVAEYDSDIHSIETVALVCRTLETIMLSLPQDPATKLVDLSWVSSSDADLVAGYEGVVADLNDVTIPELAFSSLNNKLGRLSDGEQTWSYTELYTESNRIARGLLKVLGHNAQDLADGGVMHVGLLGSRSLPSIAALLGTIQAGLAYVPLDPKQPTERLLKICDSGAIELLIVTDSFTRDIANSLLTSRGEIRIVDFDGIPDADITLPCVKSESVAYTLFTSGSTGVPKGVSVSHAAFSSMIDGQISRYDVCSQDVCALFASLSFDASLSEMFLALRTGASLVIAGDDERDDPEAFLRWLSAEGVTVATLPPAFLHILDKAPLAGLRVLITAGESAYPDDLMHYAESLHVVNGYGPTEAAVCSTAYVVESNAEWPYGVPIGTPLEGIRVSVRNDQGQRVPVGVVGELFIGGHTLANGYFQDTDKTNAAFIRGFADGPNVRWYKTGDLVRWRADGQLEFFGRRDQQLKVRGHRIETGEIEAVIRAEVAGGDACVMQTEHGLVLFVTGPEPELVSVTALKQRLAESLPSYMRPSTMYVVEGFPYSIAGKVDRKALLARLPHVETEQAVKLTDAEQRLASHWCKALNLETVLPSDDFFALGGDSIKAMRVMMWLRREGFDAKLTDFYDSPVLSDLARMIGRDSPPIDQLEAVQGSLPLLPIQQWFMASRSAEAAAHFNLAVDLRLTMPTTHDAMIRAIEYLIDRHPSLRAHFISQDGVWQQHVYAKGNEKAAVAVSQYLGTGGAADAQIVERARGPFDLGSGYLLRCLLSGRNERSITRLVLVVHHLVADWVSLRLMIDELEWALQQIERDQPLSTTEETLLPALISARNLAQTNWLEGGAAGFPGAEEPKGWPVNLGRHGDLKTAHLSVAFNELSGLRFDDGGVESLQQLGPSFLSALMHHFILAFDGLAGPRDRALRIMLEQHGRHEAITTPDGVIHSLDNMVGWLTQARVVAVPPLVDQAALSELIAAAQSQSSPDLFMSVSSPHRPNGVYTLPVDISFNYLGDFASFVTGGRLQLADSTIEGLMTAESPVDVALNIEIYRLKDTLEIQFSWVCSVFDDELMCAVLEDFGTRLRG